MNPVDRKSNSISNIENKNETIIKLDNLPDDIWQIIFNHLNFDGWSKIILTNRRFKFICENPNTMLSLWNRSNCIPSTKKVSFAIKVGADLKVFDFSKMILTEQDLVKIFSCTYLEELDLRCIKIKPLSSLKQEAMTMWQSMYSYTTSFWKKEKATTIQLTQKCLHLRKLDLSKFPYSEQIIIEMLTASPNLTALNLSGCELTDGILQHLPKALHSLCLRQCEITDQQLKLLQKLINLNILDLSYCKKITDNGLQHLNLLGALKELYLMKCNQITEAGQKYLKPTVSVRLCLDSNWKEIPKPNALELLTEIPFLHELKLNTIITEEGLENLPPELARL